MMQWARYKSPHVSRYLIDELAMPRLPSSGFRSRMTRKGLSFIMMNLVLYYPQTIVRSAFVASS